MSIPEFSAEAIHPDFTYVAEFRHGLSQGNANTSVIQGGDLHCRGLHPVGEAQVRSSAGLCLGRGLLPRLALSSDIPRARQSASIHLDLLGADVRPEFAAEYRELCKGNGDLPGGMERRLRSEVETQAYWDDFRRDGWRHRHGSLESGGQTAEEVGLRVSARREAFADKLDGFDQLERPGWGLIGFVYTHAQAIRYGLGPMLGWPDIFDVINKNYIMPNACGIVLARSKATKTWAIAGKLTIEKFPIDAIKATTD